MTRKKIVKPLTTAQENADKLGPSSLRDHVVRLYDVVETLSENVDKVARDSASQLERVSRETAQQIGSLSSKFEQFMEERRSAHRIQWPLVYGGFGALATCLTAFWFVMTMKIDGTMTPVRADMASVKAITERQDTAINNFVLPRISEITGQNSKSEQDRTDIKMRLDRNERDGRDRDIAIARLVAGNVERESQFKFEDEIRNSEYAQLQRDITTTFNMSQGRMERAPGPYYFPALSRKGNEEMKP